MLNKETQYKRIEKQLQTSNIQKIVQEFQEKIEKEICETNPTTIWHRKKYEVSLPYIEGFNERNISTKARPMQMN